MPYNFFGTAGALFVLLYIAFIVYCVLRFLNAVDRGVAAHERMAQELSRVAGKGGFGPGGA